MSRTFGPKSADHPSVGKACPICGIPFSEGDYTTLIAVGATNPQDMAAQRDNRPYNAEACEVHGDCEPVEREESDKELKSCPFCGSDAQVSRVSVNDEEYFEVYCNNWECGVQSAWFPLECKRTAIRRWNRRVDGESEETDETVS